MTFLLLLACTDGKNDDTAWEMPYCEDVATDLALDEVTDLGFAAQAMVDLAVTPSPFAETFTWAAGGETELTLTVGPAGTARGSVRPAAVADFSA